MCIAIVKPAGKILSDEMLRICFENNPDGAGFAAMADGHCSISKGYFEVEKFIEDYNSFEINSYDALVHFRITTRGDDSADNCHPFGLRSGALVHNGTIYNLGENRGQGKSDSCVLAEQLFDEDIETLRRLAPILEKYIANTRVAIMNADGEVLVLNRDQWVEEDGILFSNRSFEEDDIVSNGIDWQQPYSTSGYNGIDAWDKEYWANGRKKEASHTQVDFTDTPTGNRCKDTYSEHGFWWDDGQLYTNQNDVLLRNKKLEAEVFDAWFDDLGNMDWPITEEDHAEIDDLTVEILEDRHYNYLESTLCHSTPTSAQTTSIGTQLSTVTPSVSLPTTSAEISLLQSMSMVKSPA